MHYSIKENGVYFAAKKTYHFITGSHTKRNIFNFKYLTTYQLHKNLKEILGGIGEKNIMDFGCGYMPYKDWFQSYKTYRGADMFPHPGVEGVLAITEDGKIPYSDGQFDVVLATQVFEHTENLDYLNEVYRILQKDGKIIITVPFMYHVHDERDYRRFTAMGLEQNLRDYGFEVNEIRREGGIGAVIGIALLFWVDQMLRRHTPKWLLVLLAPVLLVWYVLVVPLINFVCIIWDRLDLTGTYYTNITAVATKK